MIHYVQAKHQPLQFLNVSTLREYLRYEFGDLVVPACNPPNATLSNPWNQQKQKVDQGQPEQAEQDGDAEAAEEAPVAYTPEMSNGQFDFERVLQDFVLLTFLVSFDTKSFLQPTFDANMAC